MADVQPNPTTVANAAVGEPSNTGAPSMGSENPNKPVDELADDTPTVITRMANRTPRPEERFLAELHGRRLGHFELGEAIGVGGMAAVVRARDVELDRDVALKILPPEIAADPENVRRFHQEARAAAKLNHENIASVYYYGEDQSLHFIAFEFVEGENLRAVIESRGRLPVEEAVAYVLQIAKGLAHSSARGVVHRDVKPSNIIITSTGHAMLVDMGLARYENCRADEALTHSGVTLGTFDYISPEQAIEPREVDVRSDIYSLGCTFYHMLTGRSPVPEGTAAKKLHHHQHVLPIDPREHNTEIPDDVVAILARMMAKDPSERYQTAENLVEHLSERACGMLSASPETPQPVQSRTPLALVGALAAVAIVGVVILHERNRESTGAKAPEFALSSSDIDSDERIRPENVSTPQAESATATKESSSAAVVSAAPLNAHAVRAWVEIVRNWSRAYANLPAPVQTKKSALTAEKVVDPSIKGVTGETYATLELAVAAAEPGDAILIKARTLRVDPLSLTKKSSAELTIRAYPGYRPVLTLGDTTERDAAMFQIYDGNLTLIGLSFSLKPDRDEFSSQTVVDLVGGGQCTFKDCVITFDDSLGKALSLATVRDASRLMKTEPATGSPIPALSLEDCMVRGQGDMIGVRAARPLNVRVDNSVIALSGSMLSVEATAVDSGTLPTIHLQLERVTTYLANHLIRLCALSLRKEPVAVHVNPATNCLFTSAEGKPLIHFEGVEVNNEQMKALLRWEGGRHNVYSRCQPILDQAPNGAEMPLAPMDQQQWRMFTGEADATFLVTSARFANPPEEPLHSTLPKVLPSQFKVKADGPPACGADVDRLPKDTADDPPNSK